MAEIPEKRNLNQIVISSSDGPEAIADWIELLILCNQSASISIRDTITQLKIGGDIESLDAENDSGQSDDELLEPIVEDAFNELDQRLQNCGAYFPFHLEEEVIQFSEVADGVVYQFLALLSFCGKDAGPIGTDGAKLFEEICAKAAEGYLGYRSASFVFGFPRKLGPSGFGNAIDYLCEVLGEGTKRSNRIPTFPNQKDAKLDIVAWKDFKDQRYGKLILFGQCATGEWKGKRSELIPPHLWCGKWMKQTPTVEPVRCFFVPHRIEAKDWMETCIDGGILFDRCRILSVLENISDDLAARLTAWVNYAKAEVLCS